MCRRFRNKKHTFVTTTLLLLMTCLNIQAQKVDPREHLLIDDDWRFAFGHLYNAEKDFNTGTGYFSYLSKAAYGDGAAAADFDDRHWRK